MYKLIRFYNQNRKTIIKIILIIVLIILAIQLLNYIAKVNNKTDNVIINNSTDIIKNELGTSLISNISVISGQGVSTTKLEKDKKIINEFLDYCNEKNINAAYELLSESCKETMFPTIQEFKDLYYNNIFNEKKIYTIENWTGSIYRVRFTEDILSTGKLTGSETKQDYITIIKEDEVDKININGYIGRKKSKKTTKYKDIEITITSIDSYMDYEIYNLSIKNISKNTVLLDTSDDTKSIYLLDDNGMKYYFYNNEIIENKLIIKSQYINTIQIKFNNSYTSTRNIDNIVFSKFVINYDEYKLLENKSEYNFLSYVVDI